MENNSKPRKTVQIKGSDDSLEEEREKPIYNTPPPIMNFNNYNNEFEKEVLLKLIKREGFSKVFN